MSAGDRCWMAMLAAWVVGAITDSVWWWVYALFFCVVGLLSDWVDRRPTDHAFRAFRSGAEYFRWHCMEHGQWPDGEKVRAAAREWRDE